MSIWKIGIVVVVASTLSACGPQSSASPQLTVNGHAVSLALYSALVAAERQKLERTGAPLTLTTSTGAKRQTSIEASVIRELIRDAVVEQLAAARGITVSPAALQARLAAVELALGGRLAFEQALSQAGLSRNDFSGLLRYRMLEVALTGTDAAGSNTAIQRAVHNARVVVSIGPCARHPYPSCVSS